MKNKKVLFLCICFFIACASHLLAQEDNIVAKYDIVINNVCYKKAEANNKTWEVVGLKDKAADNVVVVDSISHGAVVSVLPHAFYNCNMSSVQLPPTITTIGKAAFMSCKKMRIGILPESLEMIEDSVFYGCINMDSLKLNNKLKSIGNYVFDNSSLRVLSAEGAFEKEISVGDSKNTDIEFIFNPQGYGRTGWRFKKIINACKTTTWIINQDDDCPGDGLGVVNHLRIKGNIKELPEYAIIGNVQTLEILGSIEVYKKGVILGEINNIIFGSNLKKIDDGAFRNQADLKSVSIPQTVAYIGKEAFSGCKNLKSISLPGSIINLNDSIFCGCTSLSSVMLGEGIKNIGAYAFYDCKSMKSLDIPSSVTVVDEYAFGNCTKLRDVTFSNNSVPIIFSTAFAFTDLPVSPIELNDLKVTQKKITFWVDYKGGNIWYLSNNDGVKSYKKGFHSYDVPFKGSISFYGFTIIDNKLYGVFTRTIGTHGYDPQVECHLHPNTCRFKGSYTLEDADKPSYEGFAWGYKIKYYAGYGNGYKYNWISKGKSENCSEIQIDDYSDEIKLSSGKTFESFYVIYYLGNGESKTIEYEYPESMLSTIKEAKVVSNTTAVICANTNLDDWATNAGFEWRRYDAPELVPSSRAKCPVIDGVMMGALKNLNANTYYKFRPYCIEKDGTEHYGEWSAFGTADAYVYFDPIVRTYNVSNIGDNQVTVRGYAIAGSDPIVEQGFEYWEMNALGNMLLKTSLQEENRHIVKTDGQWMTATLENLDGGKQYSVRAFVKTSKETTYGETQTFTTTNVTSVDNLFYKGNSMLLEVINQSRNMLTFKIEGLQHDGKYRIYSLKGTEVCCGNVDSTISVQQIVMPNLLSGVYLLEVTGGIQRKTIRFIIR